jgi:hypothetical protein
MRRISLAAGLISACLLAAMATYRSPSATMAAAANQFLASLADSQRQRAVFPFDSEERLHWGFVPTEIFPRKGLLIKAMSAEQRRLAHELLKSALSQRGHMTVTAIIELENVLAVLERGGRINRDPEGYWVTVFGTPSASGNWGWRFEGHHISLNFTVLNGNVIATSPTFLGANPAEVRDGPQKGARALASKEDNARALLEALDATQRAVAVIADAAPNEIVTTNVLDINPLSPVGIRTADLTSSQRELLMRLIEAYTSLMAPDLATLRLAKLRQAGLDNITFAWAGEPQRGAKHYYRVQGPTFLIEYDNSQNNGNHIHSVWRDFKGDFGRDLLREHVRGSPH